MEMEVLELLDAYSVIGKSRQPNGAVLIGQVPHVGPNAWLHSVYPTLTKVEVYELESLLERSLSPSYEQFLTTVSNGLKIFSETLCLDGLRKEFGRGLEAAWQPFSLVTANIHERIPNASDEDLFIGGYSWDGSLIYQRGSNETVYRCSPDSVEPLNTWATLHDFLESEYLRIASLFTQEGKMKFKSVPTCPAPVAE